MSLTIATVSGGTTSTGGRKSVIVDITLDSSYATGGYAITTTDLGFVRRIDHMHTGVAMKSDFTASATVVFNPATSKLVCFSGGGSANTNPPEVANAASLAGYQVRLLFLGR